MRCCFILKKFVETCYDNDNFNQTRFQSFNRILVQSLFNSCLTKVFWNICLLYLGFQTCPLAADTSWSYMTRSLLTLVHNVWDSCYSVVDFFFVQRVGASVANCSLWLAFTNRAEVFALATLHRGFKWQKPAKNYVRKFLKLSGSDLCLQQFDKFLKCSTCNHRKRKLCKFAEINFGKILKIKSGELIFGGF